MEHSALVQAPTAARARLHIALVTETYPPEVNGVAASFSRVVQGLRAAGHRLHLTRPQQGEADCAQREPGYTETLVPGLGLPRYPGLRMGLPAAGLLRRLWQADRPDVVHIVTEGPLGWSALRAARRLGLPVVSEFRTNFHAYSHHYGVGWLSSPVMAYLRHFHNRTATTMVPTEALRLELTEAGFERVQVVARGVDTLQFTPLRRCEHLRAQWGATPQSLVALCVGRLAAEKNLDLLLDAAAAMREHVPGLRLVLVGDGPERERLQLRSPEAIFSGIRRDEDLARHYASADVFLFPSMTETFGNVVPEAMASGLPVVAFDHAAAGQLLRHGDNGLLARPGEASEFCRVARRAAADRGQLRALGQRARDTALTLDWTRIVEAVEASYHAARAAPAPAPATRWRKGVLPTA
ncbi:glycoside hydrolase [beta proteobacterium AAP121]|nr:glycoside hydrolase [beta proteobacterium AAP65]KPF95833.1 glycoside hydrolase [beta proteobacterium AAP121]